jgi:hypothetical protein
MLIAARSSQDFASCLRAKASARSKCASASTASDYVVVFGRSAAQRALETIKPGAPHKPLPPTSADFALARFDFFRNAKGGKPTAKIRDRMQRTTQNHCAVFRTGDVLQEGVKGHRRRGCESETNCLTRTYETKATEIFGRVATLSRAGAYPSRGSGVSSILMCEVCIGGGLCCASSVMKERPVKGSGFASRYART